MFAIEVINLRKTYGKVVAVDDVSFKVKKGEIFGFLGVNGAGKTTTINMITGLLQKDSGTIKILNHDPEEAWEYVKNRINVSTAYYPLSDALTIRQNLRIYAKIYGVKNVEQKIMSLMQQFELSHLADRKVADLSSGERTRTALCKGLINDPEVLFLDECTVGLDPDIAEKTRRIIKNYQQKSGCTILFTSHYMYEVEELCDRIAFMDKGKIIKIATADKLKKAIKKHTIEITVKSRAEELKNFLMLEQMNILLAEDNTIIFEVTCERDKIYKILNKIFTKGFLLSDLHIKKPTLDDIFIKIARGRK
ncbi:ABC transporter ATP-binding protein [Candidatus Woesearchaeota archaeon]|nr:ABC transporter ATP-binding protein [Candidatus Woesearchaeota archaeon]